MKVEPLMRKIIVKNKNLIVKKKFYQQTKVLSNKSNVDFVESEDYWPSQDEIQEKKKNQ